MSEEAQGFKPFSNNIRGDDTIDEIIKTAKDGAAFLEPHCGPNATFVARAIAGRGPALDDFTKDGITIAKSSQTDTPVHEFVRRLLVFVGEAVDRSCHDGTTTAMMFTSSLICEYLALVRKKGRREKRRLSLEMEKMFGDLAEYVDQSKITIESLAQHLSDVGFKLDDQAVKKIIAYWTAYTSTKGDKEYAQAITDSVMTYPPELYEYGRVGQRNIEEKDVHVCLSESDSDITINAKSSLNEMKGNDALRLDWHFDEAYVMIYERSLTSGDHVSDLLVKWFYTLIEPDKFANETLPDVPVIDKPLIIFAPLQSDARLMGIVRKYNRNKANEAHPILLMDMLGYDDESARAYAMGIPAMSGEGQYRSLSALDEGGVVADCLIPCKFDTHGQDAKLSNLYKKGRGPEHPFLHDKSKTHYQDTLLALETFMRNDRHRHLKVPEDTIGQILYLMQNMMSQGVRNVMSAGTTHEVIAGKSVLEDALGATISVLKYGFTLSGYVKLYDALNRSYRDRAEREGKEIDPNYVDIYLATQKALKRVIGATYDIPVDRVEEYFPENEPLAPYEVAVEDLNKIVIRKLLINDIMDPDWKDKSVAVQPIKGFEEQIRRNMDLVIKLVRTNTVILVKP